jgi:hypothetical protein
MMATSCYNLHHICADDDDVLGKRRSSSRCTESPIIHTIL